ncbi:MAG: GIY-YIG nuclease family protein [Chthoniobacterales bacterium]
MHYVYLLQSEVDARQRYVGSTKDLKLRLKQHNAGESPHTAKSKPWKLHAYFGFVDERLAAEFEQYLKSGSGREFARRHFWQPADAR